MSDIRSKNDVFTVLIHLGYLSYDRVKRQCYIPNYEVAGEMVNSYNDENSLACVLSIAYYYAKNDYIIHRELPTGKGFADMVLIPRKSIDSPAIVIELKVNKDADSAISQIHRRQYPAKVQEYADRLLLVGINYDRQTKQHTCLIERLP